MKYLIATLSALMCLSACSLGSESTEKLSIVTATWTTNASALVLGATGANAMIMVTPLSDTSGATIERTCVRTYDLAEWDNGTFNGKYRSFEFVFRGVCPPKASRKIDGYFEADLFKTKNGYQASMIQFLTGEGFGMEWWDVPKEQYSETWRAGKQSISIVWGNTLRYDMDSWKKSELKTASIRITYEKVFVIDINGIPPKDLKQEYDDMLWTMKYGFTPVFYNPNKSSNEKILPIDIKSIDIWRIKFLSDSIMIFDTNGKSMMIWVEIMRWKMICSNGGNNDFDASCEVISVKDGVMYWKSKLSWSNYDGMDTTTDTTQETSYETHIDTGITKAWTQKTHTICTSMDTQKTVPCK